MKIFPCCSVQTLSQFYLFSLFAYYYKALLLFCLVDDLRLHLSARFLVLLARLSYFPR